METIYSSDEEDYYDVEVLLSKCHDIFIPIVYSNNKIVSESEVGNGVSS